MNANEGNERNEDMKKVGRHLRDVIAPKKSTNLSETAKQVNHRPAEELGPISPEEFFRWIDRDLCYLDGVADALHSAALANKAKGIRSNVKRFKMFVNTLKYSGKESSADARTDPEDR